VILALAVGLILLAPILVLGGRENNVDSKIRELEIKVKKLEQTKQLKIEGIKNEAATSSAINVKPTGTQPVQRIRSANFSGGEIESYILAVFEGDGPTAVAIAKAESGLNPQATNWGDARFTGCPSYGIFQINRCDQNLYNWQFNVNEAHKMFHARGWWPWTVYKTGIYKQYL